jgi:hypothetical protein
LKERWIVALAVFYYVILLGGALFIGINVLQTVENQVNQQIIDYDRYPRYTPWPQLGTNYTVRNITVYHQDTQPYQGAYKPYVILTNLTGQDYHSSTGAGRLQLNGVINNTGDGTAYQLTLQIIAMNPEGKAIDTIYDLGGITPHMSLKLDRAFAYNGSALTNCTITPNYIDAAHMPSVPSRNNTGNVT